MRVGKVADAGVRKGTCRSERAGRAWSLNRDAACFLFCLSWSKGAERAVNHPACPKETIVAISFAGTATALAATPMLASPPLVMLDAA
ncbi:hypothetical protein AB1286_07590 [Trinickia sp. NRRL B-1857]|uniref:hypothetical protein n=1 Tax=Trinickia sp. NRRL B-1857 TaxID=3162879 RepID=UPI003D2B3173